MWSQQKYYILYIDEYIFYTWVDFMKNKKKLPTLWPTHHHWIFFLLSYIVRLDTVTDEYTASSFLIKILIRDPCAT